MYGGGAGISGAVILLSILYHAMPGGGGKNPAVSSDFLAGIDGGVNCAAPEAAATFAGLLE